MRMTIAALTILGSTLLVAPVPAATSAPAGGADRVEHGERAAVVSKRDRVIQLVNNRRRNHGCNALRKNAALGRAAQKHTKRMANAGNGGTLSHQLPGEPSLGPRITQAGYRNWTLAAENIAYGYPTPRQVVQGWMDSAGHRANILNCRFKHTGVGYAKAANGTPYWTQDFGKK